MAAAHPRRARLPGWWRRRRSALIGLVALTVSGALVLGATNAAFTASTANPGNSYAAGTVTLTDNDSGSAMFSPTNLKPGDSYSSCIQVAYTGTLPALLKLYGAPGGSGLAPYLDLTITRGAISSGGFGDCTNFTPDTADYGQGAGVIYTSTLGAFPSSFGAGMGDLHAVGVPEAWTTGETHAYEFTVVQQDTNAAQGLTATEDFTWHATNTTAYSEVVLSDGPAGYWKLDETGNTTTASDATGNGHDGTYTDGPVLSRTSGAKDAGTAVEFDGSDDRVVVPHDSALTPAGPFSVEAWVNPRSGRPAGTWGTVASTFWYNGNDYPGFDLALDQNDNWDMLVGDGVHPNWGPYVPAELNAWTYLVGTWDGGTVRFYVNGTLENWWTTGEYYDPAPSPDPLMIGALPNLGGPTDFFPGRIDEVAVYPFELTQSQITDHYTAGKR